MSGCLCGSSEWCLKCTTVSPVEYFGSKINDMYYGLVEMQKYLEDNDIEISSNAREAKAVIRALKQELEKVLK